MTDTWRSRVVLMLAASVLAITTGFVAYDIGRKDGYADAASTIARAPEALAAPSAPGAPGIFAVPAYYHRHSGWGGGFIIPFFSSSGSSYSQSVDGWDGGECAPTEDLTGSGTTNGLTRFIAARTIA